MNIRYLLTCMSLSYSISFYASGSVAIKETAQSMWSDEIYMNGLVWALRDEFPQKATLQEALISTRTATRATEMSNKTPWKDRASLDWLNALNLAKAIMSKKSFSVLEVTDIQVLACALSRLVFAQGGNFRRTEEHRILREIRPEEKSAHFSAISTFMKNWDADHAAEYAQKIFPVPPFRMIYPFYPQGAAYLHPAPAACKILLEAALAKAKQEFVATYLKHQSQRATEYVRIGAEFAFALITIRPFKSGHKKLGALMMYILLNQADIPIVTVKNRDEYVKVVHKCLLENSAQPLIDYWMALLKIEIVTDSITEELPCDVDAAWDKTSEATSDELTSTESVEEEPVEEESTKEADRLNNKKLLTQLQVELIKLKNEHRNGNEKIAKQPAGPALKPEGILKQCALCKKGETEVKLLRCSNCHTSWYCGTACQTKDWPKHKPGCFLRK